jgi:2'-5' RNA ligase
LFLALWPDAGARAALKAWCDATQWPADARLRATRDLHLTLHHLGPVPRASIPELTAAFALPWQPIDLSLDLMSMWHHGTTVLMPRSTPDALTALYSALADVLRRLKLPVETRQYQPHVTLARGGNGAIYPTMPAIEWHCTRYVLVEAIDRSNKSYWTRHFYGPPDASSD